jgi:dynein heavy chain
LETVQALCRLAGIEPGTFSPVRLDAISPKAVTMGQLYGEFDVNTHEWTDGILPTYLRAACDDTSKDRKWILFDGPVDGAPDPKLKEKVFVK